MSTPLDNIKDNIYSNNKESDLLLLNDKELLLKVYNNKDIQKKYSSFDEFSSFMTTDISKNKTKFEEQQSPYNYSWAEKVQESLFGALPDKSLFGIYPESIRKSVTAIPASTVQGAGALINTLTGKKIPENVQKAASDYSTFLAQTLVGESLVETQTGNNIKIGKPVEPSSLSGQLIRDTGELLLGGGAAKGVIGLTGKGVEALRYKKLNEVYQGARIKTIKPRYPKTVAATKVLAAGEVGTQVALNPEDAVIGEMLGNFIGNDEGTLKSLLNYVTADSNKTDGENRIALLFDGLFITAALSGAVKIGKLTFTSGKEMFNHFKTIKETGSTTEKEQLKNLIEETVQESPIATRAPAQLRGVENDDVLNLWRFSDNAWKRGLDAITGAFFRSEGTYTPKMMQIFNLNKNAQVAWASKGEQLMVGIDRNISKLAKENPNKYTEKQLEDLFDGYLFGSSKLDSLPTSMQDIAYETRTKIDELSSLIGQSRYVDNELRQQIKANLGKYLRTTYKKFEDPNYKPSQQHVDEAIDFVYSKYKKSASRKNGVKAGIDDTTLRKQAEATVNNLLRDAKYSDDFFTFLNTINAGKDSKIVFNKKKELASEIQNLLGIETQSSKRVFSTLNTLSDFLYKQATFDKFRIFGENKYFFTEATGQFNTQIKGKQFGALDGMWTTDTMALNFLQPMGVTFKNLDNPVFDLLGNTFKLIYGAKGFGQASKTVLNNVTHERNFQSSGIIMASNGLNPFRKETWDAMQTAFSQIKITDDIAVNDLYNKYLKLGIVNQNAKLGDIRQLLKSSEKTGIAGHVNKVLDTTGVKKGYKTIEKLYVAEDDIWKIAVFENELNTLKKAFPERNIADLEMEAARITRNVMPTYDMIPAAYKALRYSPVGNYFSFHAERFRNTWHTYKQAVNEISSDNEVLQARGWKRLLSKVTVGQLGGRGVRYGSLTMAGVSTDEDYHIKNIMQEDYNGDNWVYDTQDDTGKLLFNDTKFIDPDAPVNDATLNVIMDYIVNTDKMTQEQFDNRLIEGLSKSLSSLTAPFLDENLLSSAFLDLRTGKDKEGRAVPGWNFTENKTFDTKLNNVIAGMNHIINVSLAPAAFDNAKNIFRAAGENEDRYGIVKDFDLELYRNLTGFNYKTIDKNTLLKRAGDTALKLKKEEAIARTLMYENVASSKNPITPQDLINNVLDANKQYYRQYVESKKIINSLLELEKIDDERAFKNLDKRYDVTYSDIQKKLEELDISKLLRNELLQTDFDFADFKPLKFSEEKLDLFIRMHPAVNKYELKSYLDSIDKQLRKLPLLETRDEYNQSQLEALELLKSGISIAKATGGLVEGPDVPFTKEDPADRVDPFTGEPYQEQMSRLGFNKGGLTDAEVLEMVADKPWFQRATKPGGKFLEDEYGRHTLLTTSSGADNKEYLYPRIREVDGELIDLKDEAFKEAIDRKDYIVFEGPNREQEATEVSKKISELIMPMRQLNKQQTEGRLGFQEGGLTDYESLGKPYTSDPFIAKIIGVESSGNPNAQSPVGAKGLMQIMEPTAKQPGLGVRPFKGENLMDPKENVRFGTDYIYALENKLGNKKYAAVAYNWGYGNAKKWIQAGANVEALPNETQNYLKKLGLD